MTLYVGPSAPEGLESNWIPTADKAAYLRFRLYGPTDASFDRTFKLPDAKLVSMYANRKGLRDIDVKDNTVFSAERLNDSTGFYLTPNKGADMTTKPHAYDAFHFGIDISEIPAEAKTIAQKHG